MLKAKLQRALGARLMTLLSKVEDATVSYNTIAGEAEAICEDHKHASGPRIYQNGLKLLMNGWRDDWLQPGSRRTVYNGLFLPMKSDPELEDLANSLHDAFIELIRLVMDRTSPHEEQKNRDLLKTALKDYLARQGFKVHEPARDDQPALSKRERLILNFLAKRSGRLVSVAAVKNNLHMGSNVVCRSINRLIDMDYAFRSSRNSGTQITDRGKQRVKTDSSKVNP